MILRIGDCDKCARPSETERPRPRETNASTLQENPSRGASHLFEWQGIWIQPKTEVLDDERALELQGVRPW